MLILRLAVPLGKRGGGRGFEIDIFEVFLAIFVKKKWEEKFLKIALKSVWCWERRAQPHFIFPQPPGDTTDAAIDGLHTFLLDSALYLLYWEALLNFEEICGHFLK